MRNLLILGALAAAGTGAAYAQEVSISGNVTLTTDYQWRNVSQSNQDWAIQGGFDLATDAGFYAGVWASNVDFSDEPEDTNLEMDLYGGYGFEVGSLGFDVGFIYYAYPDAGTADLDFYEIYGGISTTLAGFDLGAKAYWDPDNETFYLDGSVGYALTDSFSVDAGVGSYLEGFGEYTGWNVGATLAVAGVDLGVRYYDTDINGADDNVLFSVSKSM